MGSKIWCYRLVHPILLGLTWKRTKSSPAANSVAWCLQRLLRPSAIQKPWHKSCSPCSWSPLWPQHLWMCPFFCKTYQPFRHGQAIFFVTLINHQFLGRIPLICGNSKATSRLSSRRSRRLSMACCQWLSRSRALSSKFRWTTLLRRPSASASRSPASWKQQNPKKTTEMFTWLAR